jgi:hypothetical protein
MSNVLSKMEQLYDEAKINTLLPILESIHEYDYECKKKKRKEREREN